MTTPHENEIPEICTVLDCRGAVRPISYSSAVGYTHSCKRCAKGYPEKSAMANLPHENDGRSLGEVMFRAVSKHVNGTVDWSKASDHSRGTHETAAESVAAEVRRRDGDRVRELEAKCSEYAQVVLEQVNENSHLKAEVERLKTESVELNKARDRQASEIGRLMSQLAEMEEEQDADRKEIERLKGDAAMSRKELIELRSCLQDVTPQSELKEFTKAAMQGQIAKHGAHEFDQNSAEVCVMAAKATLAALRKEQE